MHEGLLKLLFKKIQNFSPKNRDLPNFSTENERSQKSLKKISTTLTVPLVQFNHLPSIQHSCLLLFHTFSSHFHTDHSFCNSVDYIFERNRNKISFSVSKYRSSIYIYAHLCLYTSHKKKRIITHSVNRIALRID